MYRITYRMDNGYNCACCRETFIETEDYETLSEAQDRAKELVQNQFNSDHSRGYNVIWDLTLDWGATIEETRIVEEIDLNAIYQQLKKQREEDADMKALHQQMIVEDM